MSADHEARRVTQQQAAVARMGLAALSGMAVGELMQMAVQDAAQTLGAPLAKILEWLPHEGAFVLAAGVGWPPELVGSARVEGGATSLAGYTLEQDEPVIVADLAAEQRFSGQWLLREQGVVSGVSVVIHGRERPFGIFGVYRRSRQPFSAQDATFVQAAANVVGTAIERHIAEEALRHSQQRLAVAMEASGAGVYEHTVPLAGDRYHNRRWAEILGYRREELPTGEAFLDWLLAQVHPEDAKRQAHVYGDFLLGRRPVYEVELRLRHKSGAWVWVRSFAQALERDAQGHVRRLAGMMFDISAQKQAQEERERLLRALTAATEGLEERVAQRTEQLQRRTEQLRATASSLTVAEQRERERISRILHDDLQQLLYAAQMQATMLESEVEQGQGESWRAHLRELDRLHAAAVAVTRSLTVELSPPVLEGEGLVEALEWLTNHMTKAYGLDVLLQVEQVVEPESNDLRELLFQMVRELLFNVVKHAGVNEARVTVRGENGRCVVEVADEGKGFDAAALEEKQGRELGFGLRSMRERLALFEGTLVVETKEGGGTRVVTEAPGSAII